MKYRVEVTMRQTVETDFGELPEALVKEIVTQLDGGLGDSCWTVADLPGHENWETVEVEVTPLPPKRKAAK